MIVVVSVAASGWIVRIARWGGAAGETTEGRRDKSRRCAPSFGRVFSDTYGASARCAPDRRSLRICHFYKDFLSFERCAGP
jgi:hypothetical protein